MNTAIESQPSSTCPITFGGEALDAKVMILDDEPINVTVARKYLQNAGYHDFVELHDSTEALARLYVERPDVLLVDLQMPGVSGQELIAAIRADDSFASLPILVLTASTDSATKAQALTLGATDFLAKPVDPIELAPRVRNALLAKRQHEKLERLVRQRTVELERSRMEVIHCLARAAEFRDNETGRHILRVGRYAGVVARVLGWDEADATMIELAATLHDVGKIGIPDAVLLKPGKLDAEEFDVMKQHSEYGDMIVGRMDGEAFAMFSSHSESGANLMRGCSSPILQMASRIAFTHHERWDGGGYPRGLAKTEIPIEGRITAVVDVFDALSSERPYKRAFPLEKCFSILQEGSGTHFDPEVVEAFFSRESEIVEIQQLLADEPSRDELPAE